MHKADQSLSKATLYTYLEVDTYWHRTGVDVMKSVTNEGNCNLIHVSVTDIRYTSSVP